MLGTARAALWGARPREHCSSGTLGTARAAQRGVSAGEQSLSDVGENAQVELSSGEHLLTGTYATWRR
jgi:hypothetical protein